MLTITLGAVWGNPYNLAEAPTDRLQSPEGGGPLFCSPSKMFISGIKGFFYNKNDIRSDSFST